MKQLLATVLNFSILFSGIGALTVRPARRPHAPAHVAPVLLATPSDYQIIDLGTLGGTTSIALNINERGDVAGWSQMPDFSNRGFIWTDANGNGVSDPGDMRDLGQVPGKTNVLATDVNYARQVVGYAYNFGEGSSVVFTWQESNGFTELLSFLATPNDFAFAVNDSGQIVGRSSINPSYTHATMWEHGVPRDLGAAPGYTFSEAVAVNNSGQAVGRSTGSAMSPGSIRGFIWQNGILTDLGIELGDTGQVTSINNSSQVVGNFFANNAQHGFLWKDGVTTEIAAAAGTSAFLPADINDQGQVVGRSVVFDGRNTYNRASIWTDTNNNGRSDSGELVDLNTYLPTSSGWVLNGARAINNKGQIVGNGIINGANHGYLLTPKSRRPVLIIPGIAGTFAANTTPYSSWLLNRGVPPEQLQIDPLGRFYHDIIKTLENVGYVRDKDLFIVNYDWRLLPGPLDGSFDGVVSGINARSISDQTFEYGVDYLGLALRRAAERWKQDHNGEALDEVDLIAHSTGGLVSRTYIQSPAYNAIYNGSDKLPKVKNMIMVGVPNRGASKAWNALHDNWNADEAYRYVLSKIVDAAFAKIARGNTITGPDYSINWASILDTNGNPDHIQFIRKYVPTIQSLLATYDFADFGNGYENVNGDLLIRNDWVLDLNNGLDLGPTTDPSPFANECEPTIIYASNQATPTFVKRILTGGDDVLFNFDDWSAGDVPADFPWFMEIPSLSGGDGTVPVVSSTGQFVTDGRFTLREITSAGNDHTGLMSNIDAQSIMLEKLGASFQLTDISTGSTALLSQGQAVLTIFSDPVDGFVVDGAGRRLGYSAATGPVTEIPGSVWFGDADGAGWVFGPIQEPLRVELTGRGEDYYFKVSVQTQNGTGGVVDEGFLALGQQTSLPITIGTPPWYKCPLPKGDWKNNPGMWPVDSLTLGGFIYNKSELLTILNTAVGTGKSADASLIVAQQLIAAKLNLANGSDPNPLAGAIVTADNLLAGASRKLPLRISPSTTLGQGMVNTAVVLDNYNNGLLTTNCGP